MSHFAILRQRLPCAGLFLWAAAGVIVGRFVDWPGGVFALAALVVIALSLLRPLQILLPLGVGLVFATSQAWRYRESPAVRLAAQLSEAPQSCEATLQVLEVPSGGPERSRFVARLLTLSVDGRKPPTNCNVLVTWIGVPAVYGGEYSVRASIQNCPTQRNPGAFDYTKWLANEGIRSQLSVFRAKDATLIKVGGNPLVRFAQASCAWIERTISLGIDGTPEAVLIRAMTVGNTSDASDALKDAFRETGTFHLFSVSGLHVGIVAILLWAVLGSFGVSQRRSVLIVIPALFFYALLTGWSAASVRAAIMLSVIAGGLVADRAPVAVNNIGAAGLALLVWDSSALFNPGFQLSFGAVAAICLLATPLQRILGRFIEPDPFLPTRLIRPFQRIVHSFATSTLLLITVSFAAWLASLPLVIFYFHLVSLSSIPANLLAVPLSSIILALAAVSIVVGAVWPWLAEVFNNANFLLTKVLVFVVQAFASVPGSAIYVGPPLPSDTLARVVVLDAGRGGATALFTHGATWLIDGGSTFFAGSVALPYLRREGVNRLDTVVLTHGDAQHLGGFEEIAGVLHPRMILDSGLKDRSPGRRRILESFPTAHANTGDTFPLGDKVRVKILYPPTDLPGMIADDQAVVLRVETESFSALFMSDAGLNTELWLLANAAADLPCDIVVMGRHISGLSGDLDFLRAANPRAVIASAASFPSEEKARPDWIAAVRALGIDVLSQNETGAVTVTVKRDSFKVEPYLSTGGAPRVFTP